MLERISREDSAPELFSTGDVVGKGPDVPGALALVEREGIRAVLGNHEAWLLRKAEILRNAPSELEEKLADLKKDLFTLRMQHATNQLDNPVKITEVKRNIARVKTVLREKELGGND